MFVNYLVSSASLGNVCDTSPPGNIPFGGAVSRVCALLAALLVVAVALSTSGCSSSSTSSSISLGLSPSSSQAIDQNQTVSLTATLMNDNSFKGISWSLNGPGSLSSLTGSSVTYNSPTANLTSPQQVTVTAMSVADSTKRASVQITVNPVPQIPFQTLARGTVGVAYNQPITLTGGTAPFQWSVYNGPIVTGSSVGGAIPDGLRMDPSKGPLAERQSPGEHGTSRQRQQTQPA